MAGEHGVAELGQHADGVRAGARPAVKQRPGRRGFHAALQVDHPHPHEPVADHRAERAQRVPHQAGLAGAGGADAEEVLPPQPQGVGAAVLVFADHHRAQVHLAGQLGDAGGGDDEGERHAAFDDQGEHAGAVAGGGDLVHAERVGQRGQPFDPGLEVLAGDDPYPHGVDRGRDRPHPADTRDDGAAAVAVVAGQLTRAEQPGPAARRGRPTQRRQQVRIRGAAQRS